MQLTHTDLKPENILFVMSDSELEYDPKAVSNLVGVIVECSVCLSVCLSVVLRLSRDMKTKSYKNIDKKVSHVTCR